MVILDAASVIVGGDAVFGDVDGHAGFFGGVSNYSFHALGVILPANLSEFGAFGRWQVFLADNGSRIGLHAEIVAGFGGFEPRTVDIGAFLRYMTVGRRGLIVRHGEIEADGHAAARGLHGRFALGMGGKNTITNFFAVTEKEAGKFGCVEVGARFQESALQHLYEALSLGAGKLD